MDKTYYQKYEPIFGSWYIKEFLGEGSFGEVYEIERQDFGKTYKAALKAITIPKTQSEIRSVMADGLNEDEATRYFNGIVQDVIREFELMSKLKGNSNIVSYEDHVVIAHESGIGWDILIRMELLTPLFDFVGKEQLTQQQVLNLGIDLCKALESCEKYKIVHRDIKPENIFISEEGNYKLGDFGIARIVEKTSGGLSKKGTYTYMAPEIYCGGAYNSSVDVYSLGIVLYRFLNGNRTPFLPAWPEEITHHDREDALLKRVKGEAIPPPVNGGERLAEVVLKACAYQPEERYASAKEMEEALTILTGEDEQTQALLPDETKQHRKKRGKRWWIIAAAIVAALVIAVAFIPKKVTNIIGIEERIDIYAGDTQHLHPKPEPDWFREEQAAYEIKDPKIADVNEDGQLTAKTAGETKLLIVVKNFTKTVLIVVKPKVTGIKEIPKTINLQVGQTMTLKPKLSPKKFKDETIRYQIKNEKLVTVTAKGKLKAKKAGKTTLVISAGGYEKQVTVKIEKQAASSEYTPSSSAQNQTQREYNQSGGTRRPTYNRKPTYNQKPTYNSEPTYTNEVQTTEPQYDPNTPETPDVPDSDGGGWEDSDWE